MYLNPVDIENIRREGLISVVIAVCTYKRPEMLDACLHSISAQNIPPNILLNVLVVDNDPMPPEDGCGNPRAVYVKWGNGFAHQAYYRKTAKRGISIARNAALLFAIHLDADYLCFIDDDEIAHEDWLSGLMHPDYKNVPILAGWNVTDYGDTPNWARPRIPKRKEEGALIGQAMGGNVRIHKHVFNSIKFNNKIGLGGGEDGEFFATAARMGFEQRFTARALTYEVAHPERYTMSGQINRAYWNGASSMREFMILRGKKRAILAKIPDMILAPFKGLLYLTIGTICFPANRPHGLRVILKGSRALAKLAGRVVAIFGHIPQAYKVTYGK